MPCIMQWQGKIAKGAICNQMAASIDLYPTLANLTGIDLPENLVIDGVDLTGLLLGQENSKPRSQFFYFDQARGLKAIRSGNWKLFMGIKPQLYNLKEDIGEQHNIATKHREIVAQLSDIAMEFSNELEKNKRAPGLEPLE